MQSDPTPPRSVLDRALSLFSEVRAGEGARAVVMLANVFLLLTAYYVIKTVREPMILADGSAELKSWASAGQALALLVFVPAYSWLASRAPRRVLIVAVSGFFVLCLQLFYPVAVDAVNTAATIEQGEEAADAVGAAAIGVAEAVSAQRARDGVIAAVTAVEAEAEAAAPSEPRRPRPADFLRLGFVFYVWVGIFSLAMIAQFWSFANDIYSREAGDRIFPIIAIGATVGAAFGSKITAQLFSLGVEVPAMLQIASALVALHALILWLTSRRLERSERTTGTNAAAPAADMAGGFGLVLRSGYLRWIALVVLLLNLVNTNGEYILSKMVLAQALALKDAGEIASVGAYIGAFYGDFFSVVNIATMAVQALLVSRIVRYAGMRGVLFALPIVALGAYSLAAAGVGLVAYRWAKTAENTTDYSVMNTAKALVWLPTSRAEKYAGKQAIDTFVVRLGDLGATGLMLIGTELFAWSVRSFALANVALACVWLASSAALFARYSALVRSADRPARDG